MMPAKDALPITHRARIPADPFPHSSQLSGRDIRCVYRILVPGHRDLPNGGDGLPTGRSSLAPIASGRR